MTFLNNLKPGIPMYKYTANLYVSIYTYLPNLFQLICQYSILLYFKG